MYSAHGKSNFYYRSIYLWILKNPVFNLENSFLDIYILGLQAKHHAVDVPP